MTETAPLYLNCNETMPVQVVDGQLRIDFSSTDGKQFWKNVAEDIQLQTDQGNLFVPHVDAETKYMTLPISDLPRNQNIRILLRGQPVAEFHLSTGHDPQPIPSASHGLYQLTVAETRGLSYHLNDPAPKSPPYDRMERVGFDPDKHGPITDLHTHFSSQLRPRDLFEIALHHDEAATDKEQYVTYPVELLEKIVPGSTKGLPQLEVNSFEFPPLKSEGLACEQGKPGTCQAIRLRDLTPEQRKALIRKMDASETQTKNFQQVERDIYRYSNPLMKNPNLTKEMIRKVAEDYARNGIEYAELATGAMLNPAWFEQMVEAIDEIENGTKNPDGTRNNDAITVGPNHRPLHLRFLVGLPRNKAPEETMRILERTKFLLRHPYIVGIDLMGNEMGGTSEFLWALSHMAQWARQSEGTDLNPDDGWDFKEDCLIRVHAGETAKNPKNVADALHIAQDHKVRVRVGHGQNAKLIEMDKDALRHMRKHEGEMVDLPDNKQEKNPHNWFGMEICSDSNQFYEMWPQVHQVVMKARHELAHIFLCSDGNGMVHSSPRQLAFSAIAAGLGLDDLAGMRHYEHGYIDQQMERDTRKTGAFLKRYPGGNEEFCAAYRAFMPEKVMTARFKMEGNKDKTPILIGGAGGEKSSSSWNALSQLDHRKIEQMMHLLVNTLDPKKTYFVLGRVQNEGVSKALDVAVMRYNQKHPQNKFSVLGRYANANNVDSPMADLPESVSGLQRIKGDIDMVPNDMIHFLHDRDGKAFLFAGAQFTGDMLNNCMREDTEVPFWAFMPKGSEVQERMSAVVPPQHHMMGPNDLLDILAGRDGKQFACDKTGQSLIRSDLNLKDPMVQEILLEQAQKETQTDRRGKSRRAVALTSEILR